MTKNSFYAVIINLILMISSNAIAKDCEKGATTMAEVNECTNNESDSALKIDFESLKALLTSKKLVAAREQLEKSQVFFEAYRDASCMYVFEIAEKGGSGLYSYDAQTNCNVKFNTDRQKILQKYKVDCQKGAKSCAVDQQF